jgi:hypothetical protein
MQRMEIGPGMPERIQRMRTEYSSDRLRSVIDIGGMNARISRQPRAGRGMSHTQNGCVRHHRLAAFVI